MKFKDLPFFYYSKSERRTILILLVALLLMIGLCLYLNHRVTDCELTADEQQEVEEFMNSLHLRERTHRDTYTSSYKYGSSRRFNEDKLSEDAVLAPFDPNEADSLQLLRLGLPERVVRSILHYRSRGGVFRTVESFARIYTLGPSQYQALEPYIRIGSQYQSKGERRYADANSDRPDADDELRKARMDSLRHLYPVKFTVDTVLDLNSVDTTLLQRVPGIGRTYARAIVKLRRDLGGFYSIKQLSEVSEKASEWSRWLAVQTPPLRSIKINRWGVERLRSHPYLNFYQAQKIVECRKQYGRITDLSRLAFYEDFTEADLLRLEPYVDYN